MSAPSSRGRCSSGVAKVLSTDHTRSGAAGRRADRREVGDLEQRVGRRLDPQEVGLHGPLVPERVACRQALDSPPVSARAGFGDSRDTLIAVVHQDQMGASG